ncbi:hypothetical protein A2318_01265 [Candidatus Uhrbacteria bacterium RIFOXYB2_FULL_45_11]|uniref:Uncharacterized protein n=1 Tax=Candidatus Uhrbacteria bacterium RIFOXYB2_FULL_45_11 TaxID=1802421 RepID=A0A1F7W5X9_9BACT|nr:MAG: hypothetical protein A2318_01265 [Candidatus Uhrbacteria bacterium RIFOXYB2_FULL_45_11]
MHKDVRGFFYCVSLDFLLKNDTVRPLVLVPFSLGGVFMSDFVEQTRLRFEQMFRGHRTRLSEVATRWRPEMDQLAHRVVELVCMDGRISPIMPYGLAPIVPIAGGVPQDQNKPYQEWLKRNVGRAKKEKGGLIQLVQLHTECAAFDRSTDLAIRAATHFDKRVHKAYADDVHNIILLYNVIHGGVSIFESTQQRWYELLSLDRDQKPNPDSGFFKAGSMAAGNEDLVSDLARIAYMARFTRQIAGRVVQKHRELGIVAGDITVPWRGNADFLSYRMDLVDDTSHVLQLKRAAAVVRGALNSSGKSCEPICIFVVRRTEAAQEDGKNSVQKIQKLIASVLPQEEVVLFPYHITKADHLVAE